MQHNLLLITLIPFIKYSHVNMIQIQCAVKYIEMAHSLWTEHQFRRKNVKWTHRIVSLDLNNNNREWRGSSSGLGSRSFIRIQLVQSSEEEDVLEWRACKKQKKMNEHSTRLKLSSTHKYQYSTDVWKFVID